MMKPVLLLFAFPTLPVLWLLIQTGDTSPAPISIPMNRGQMYIALIVAGMGAFTQWMASRRETRARKWQEEDRVRNEAAAKTIREELEKKADSIETEAYRRTDELKRKIDENTRLTGELGSKLGAVPAVAAGQVAVKITPLPERRPSDSAPKVGRRETDPPPVPPTRRTEDEPEPKS